MGTRSSRTARPGPPYRWSAQVYETVYAWKDYRSEARRIRELVQRFGRRPSRTLLDVACGTGSHLRYLVRWYRVTGLDQNTDMLRQARRNVPRARFVEGSMQRFRLSERFDVITCLFSAIGYTRSEQDLRRTISNFARHLNPGGVLIVEPWLTPTEYRTGSIHVGTYGSREQPIVRMNSSELRGSRSVMDMHYLVADGGKIRHWVERHALMLFDVPTQLAAFRAAGLRVRRLPSRFTSERGIYVAVRPEPADGRRPDRRRAAAPTSSTATR